MPRKVIDCEDWYGRDACDALYPISGGSLSTSPWYKKLSDFEEDLLRVPSLKKPKFGKYLIKL